MGESRVCFWCWLPLVALSGTLEGGQIQRQPDGLAAGARYRLAFVTSTLTKATSAEISTYNDFVQTTADAAPDVGQWGLEWRAIASTVDVDARDNTHTNPQVDESVPIYLVNGDLLVPNYDALWFGPLPPELHESLRFNVTELGDRLVEDTGEFGVYVWTGSDQYGRALVFGQSRGGRGPLGMSSAIVGDADDAPGAWFDEAVEDTTLEYPLYAISEVLLAVPEPSSSMLLRCMGVLTIISSRRQNRYVASA